MSDIMNGPSRLRTAPSRLATGAATLSIVLVLFLIMAMVAAYANRGLIFEQRVSLNNYRATVAMDSAEAGVDWVLAQLNGGLVDGTCSPDVAAANDFRTRYLSQQDDGIYTVRTWTTTLPSGATSTNALASACGIGATWACSCPSSTAPTPAASTSQPAFRANFAGSASPGVVTLTVLGCSNFGTAGSGSCAEAQGSTVPDVESHVRVEVALGLVRALPTVPIAALTAGGTVTQSGSSMSIANGDAATALALHTGSMINVPSLQLAGPAGSTASAQSVGDTSLRSLATGGRFFESVFGADRTTYRQQPGAARVDCSTTCTLAAGGALAAAINANPGRVVFAAGNVNLDAALPAASAAMPLMLVVDGDLSVSAAQSFTGFVYANNVTLGAAWNQLGALVVAGDFVANANATTIAYDAAAMRRIALGYGSFVRVPGSWKVL